MLTILNKTFTDTDKRMLLSSFFQNTFSDTDNRIKRISEVVQT
jgi:hypothetical protein